MAVRMVATEVALNIFTTTCIAMDTVVEIISAVPVSNAHNR